MAARKWTDEQRQRQAAAIRTWAPWAKSTGPRTPAGKAVASKNAVNYSCRALLRETARQNRVLIAFINGMGPAPCYNRTAIDGLLDKVASAVDPAGQIPEAIKSGSRGGVAKDAPAVAFGPKGDDTEPTASVQSE